MKGCRPQLWCCDWRCYNLMGRGGGSFRYVVLRCQSGFQRDAAVKRSWNHCGGLSSVMLWCYVVTTSVAYPGSLTILHKPKLCTVLWLWYPMYSQEWLAFLQTVLPWRSPDASGPLFLHHYSSSTTTPRCDSLYPGSDFWPCLIFRRSFLFRLPFDGFGALSPTVCNLKLASQDVTSCLRQIN